MTAAARPASAESPAKDDAASATPKKHHKGHVKKVSVATPQDAAKKPGHHGKATKPTRATADDKPQAGETVGGTGHHGKHASTAQQAHHRAATAPAPAVAAVAKKGPCLHDAVEIAHGLGGETETVVLTRCDGHPAPKAVEQLSVLVRPMNAPRPTLVTTPVRHGAHLREVAPGVKIVDRGLVTRLQQVVDHFKTKKLTIVSGYRPASLGSFHQSARAIDFRVEGVSNEELVAYCRTMGDTGCGYYPNSSFVHMDVRAPRTGHVYWIDASGPGEAPKYVATWPLKDAPAPEIPRPDPAAPADENTHPDATPPLPPGASDAKIDATTTAPATTPDVEKTAN